MMKRRRTVLIFRPLIKKITSSSPWNKEEQDHFPLSLAHIVSLLKKGGFRVIVIDPSQENLYSPKEIYSAILKENPFIVGISCFTYNRIACREIAEIVKKTRKNITVVFGGLHATFLYRQILIYWPVDIVVLYEGENTFLEVCNKVYFKRDLRSIKGIAFRDGSKITNTPPAPFIQNLDTLPFPSYGDFKIQKANPLELFSAKKRLMRMNTSRGCSYSCNFCASKGMWKKKVRIHSLDRVIEEIKFVKEKYKINIFSFTDINFVVNSQRTINLCKRLIKGNIDIRWICSARADDRLSSEVLKWMKLAGCILIQFGVESFSNKILKSLNKGVDAETSRATLSRVFETGIKLCINLILGSADESKETIEETLLNVKKLPPIYYLFVNILQLHPGSDLYREQVNSGKFDERFWLSELPAPACHPKNLSLDELRYWKTAFLFYWLKSRQMGKAKFRDVFLFREHWSYYEVMPKGHEIGK